MKATDSAALDTFKIVYPAGAYINVAELKL